MMFGMKPVVLAAALSMVAGGAAVAASCSNSGGGYEAWKSEIAAEASAQGVGAKGIQALMATRYSSETIAADRNQKSFKYTIDKFMKVRGADTIVKQGRGQKAKNAKLFNALEQAYGVPAGILVAIHGMETAFGGYMGSTNIVAAISTLTYDCRRSDFFRPHMMGALILVDRGSITAQSTGAKHGEWGHTQFLPGNALKYGVDGDGNGRVDLNNRTDALASTANFLRQKGWKPGQGYQKGQPNYAVLKDWNAASVYQEAIAIMAARIDK